MTRSIKTEKSQIKSRYPLYLSTALVKPVMTLATIAALSSTAYAQVAPDATPYGEDVIGGSATFDRPSTGVLNIDQTSDRAVINWERFDIGENASTTFYHNNSGSMTVNRVTGAHSDSTQILGSLSSVSKASGGTGGTIFVLDRNGIVFGENAQIDVGGLVASTGDLNTTSFMNGDTRIELSNFTDAQIVNYGTITVADAGIAAFVSPQVSNHGVIKANVGKVAFAAGDKVTLDFYGDSLVEIALEDQIAEALLDNTGAITAAQVEIKANAARGVVDSVINMGGIVTASTATESGGKIILGGGSAGKVTVDGTLKASRTKKGNGGTGGSVEITGQDIEITEDGRVWANGDDDTQAGDIKIVADRRLDLAGRLRAKGVDGTIETSGATLNVEDTTAVSASLWTIDPLSILIADTAYLGNYSYINAGVLSTSLSEGTSILIQTGDVPTGSGHDHGDIRIGSMINNNGGSATLSFEALRDIIVESGAGIGGTGTTEVNVDAGRNITLNGSIETNGADITLTGTGSTRVYSVLSAASGDIYFDGGDVKFFDGSVVMADEIDFTANSVAQESLSEVAARLLTGSVQKKVSLYSDLNSFDEIGDFATGLGSSTGGLEVYDNSGSLLITGLIDSDRGAVRFGHEGTIWSEEIKLTNSGEIQTSNGAVDLNSTSRVIVHGDIDAGNGAVTIGASAVQFWNGSEVLARSLTFDASSVRQDVGSKVDVQRVSGTVLTTFDLDSVLNEIDIIDGIATGTAGWHDGGLDLYSKNFLQINAPVSTTGGSINITSEQRIDVKDGSYVSAVDGDIFLGGTTINLWEDLNTTGTVSGNATLVNIKDDAAEIQDAVDLSSTSSTVNVAKGDYYEDVLVDGKNIDLRGARSGTDARGRTGDESTIYGSVIFKNASDGEVRGFSITGGTKGVRLENVSNFLIANNIITDIKDNTGYDDDGVFLDNAQDVLVQRNVINNSGDDGIHARNNVDGLVISQNEIGKAAGDSIDLHITSGAIRVDRNDISGGSAIGVHAKNTESVVVTRNTITGTRNEGIKVTDGSTSALVQNNTVTGGTNGVEVNGGSAHTVSSNTIINSRSDAIVVTNADYSTVKSNTVNSAGDNGIAVSGSDYVGVSGNTITDAENNGIVVTNSGYIDITGGNTITGGKTGVRLADSDYADVIGNTISGQSGVGPGGYGDGVNVVGSDFVRIMNNTISDTSHDGIELESTSHNADIKGNTLTDISGNGIVVRGNSDNADVQNNSIDNAKNGVTVSGNSANIIVARNTIENTRQNGVVIGADAERVSQNTLTNINGDAIDVSNSADVKINNNTITGTAGEGIDLNSSNGANIYGNVITDATTNGISVTDSDDVTVGSNNTVTGGQTGLRVENSDRILITGNSFSNQTGAGSNGIGDAINLDNSDAARILNNIITATGDDGIDLENGSDDATISRNTVNGAGDNAITVRSNSDNVTIQYNSLYEAQNGVRVYGGADNAIIINNTADDMNGKGIAVAANAIRVNNNTVSNTGNDGIEVSNSADVDVIGNNVSQTGGESIDVNNSANADIKNNTVSGTASNGISINPSPSSVITGNTVTGAGANGVDVSGSNGTLVKNNEVFDSTLNGIAVSGSDDVRVEENLVIFSGANGIAISGGADNTVEENIVALGAGNGIFAENTTGLNVADNIAGLVLGDAIRVEGGLNSTITGNLVGLSYGDGIALDGATGTTTVSDNKVLLVGGNGISSTNGADTVNIDGNEVAIAGENGIYIDGGAYVNITDNSIAYVGFGLYDWVDTLSSEGLGALFDGDYSVRTPKIDTDLIAFPWADGDGIHVENAGDILVDENTIAAVGGDGVEVDDSGATTVTNNNVFATGIDWTSYDFADLSAYFSGLDLIDDVLIPAEDALLGDEDLAEFVFDLLPEPSSIEWDSFGGNGIYVHGNFSDDVVISDNMVALTAGDGINTSGYVNVDVSDNIVSIAGDDGIDVTGAYSVTISENTVEDSDDNGIRVAQSLGAIVSENTVVSSGGNGIDAQYNAFTSITGNDVNYSDENGIIAQTGNAVVISDNEVARSGVDGIAVRSISDVDITGNKVKRSGDEGIDVSGANTADIIDNKVKNTDDNGIKVSDSSWVKIAENKVVNAGDDGIDVDDVTSRRGFGWNVQITDNTVSNSGDDGIDVADSRNVYINGNVVTDSDSSGMELSDINIVVATNNEIYASGQEGIDGDDIFSAFLGGNTIAGADSDGIELDDVTFATLVGNTISDVDSDGIDVDDSFAVSVVDNTVEDAGDNGIELSDAVFAYVGDNRVKRSGDDGVDLDDINFATVENNRIRRSGDDGVDAEDVGVLFVRDNIIKNSDGNGVEVTGGDFARINRNVITNSDDSGVDVYGTDLVRVNRNDISSSGDNGIYVENAENVRVKYNTIYDSGENGVYVIDVDGAANVKWNTISESEEDGILVEEVDVARIIGNNVSLSGDDGVDVARSDAARIKGNVITTSGDDGIDVDSVADVRIIDNNVTDSDDNGITVYDAYNVNVAGNLVKDSGADGITVYDVYNSVNVAENTVRRSGDEGIEVDGAFSATIADNIVRRSGDNGIEVYGAYQTNITGNDVKRSRTDGINVSDVYGNPFGYAVYIADNTIEITGDDGIEVAGAGRTRIESNTITNVGVTKDRGDFFGADAIHVRDVNGGFYGPAIFIDGPSALAPVDSVEIVGNTIDTTGDDGIQVLFSGNTSVADNVISNVGTASGARIFGADAISITTSGAFDPYAYIFGQSNSADVSGNTITNVLGDGIEIDGANEVLVDGNTLSNIGDDGINITGYNGYFPEIVDGGDTLEGIQQVSRKPLPFGDAPEFNAVVSNNVITTVGGDGVETTNLNRAEIAGNEITGAAFNGYYASGPFNGQVVVSDNLFFDNDTGASFESGEVDLTGLGNGFIGGRVGMHFAPYDFEQLALVGDNAFGAWSYFAQDFPTTGFADMSLVDNTIGTQLFNGQSDYFVELDNGAFFAPGTPTVLNALNSTYFVPGEGFIIPASTGGVLTLDQFNFLEDKFYHFTDEASLGLFFFGFVPGINQEDIFRNIDGFDPDAFNVRLTILGLPRVSLPTGFDPEFLSQIAPAAGGEGGEADLAAQLNAIESAAGGAEETSCQGAALSSAETGAAITYSFGSSLDELALDSAVGCGI